MQALFIVEKNKLGFMECDVPTLDEYDCLVKVEACGICNSTDIKIMEGRFKKGPFPILLGHESVGRIVEIGPKVTNYAVGDIVLRPRMYDKDLSIDGSVRFGGFSQYAVVTDAWAREGYPYNTGIAHPQQNVPSHIPISYAASLITLKENLNTIQRTGVTTKDSLAIVGTGPVAQSMVVCAKNLGIAPIVVFGRRQKWEKKFADIGAHEYVAGNDYPAEVSQILSSGGFDKVVEAVGSNEALSHCLKLAKKEGSVHIYGMPADDEPYEASLLQDKRVSVVKVKEAQAHDEMLAWIEEGKINLEDWVSHILPWEEYDYAFNQVKLKLADKVVLRIH